MKIKIGGRELEIENVKKLGPIGRFKGLMFCRREKTPAMLFEMKSPFAIHSFFCFYDFLALWLDKDDNVVEWRVVKPWNLYVFPKESFSRLLEVPINRRYEKLLRLFHLLSY